jgi:hypothetical protein
VYTQTGQKSRDKFLASGQHVVVTGEVIEIPDKPSHLWQDPQLLFPDGHFRPVTARRDRFRQTPKYEKWIQASDKKRKSGSKSQSTQDWVILRQHANECDSKYRQDHDVACHDKRPTMAVMKICLYPTYGFERFLAFSKQAVCSELPFKALFLATNVKLPCRLATLEKYKENREVRQYCDIGHTKLWAINNTVILGMTTIEIPALDLIYGSPG